MKYFLTTFFLSVFVCLFQVSCSQPLQQKKSFTLQDTLRGSITPQRAWWNVLHYDISVDPDFATKSIKGKTTITFEVISSSGEALQVDLQQPLQIDSIWVDGILTRQITTDPTKNFYFIQTPAWQKNTQHQVTIAYHGKPIEAANPPWDGGWIWSRDAQNRPWMSVACQGLGASVWYPCKDHQSDEPENGARLSIKTPVSLAAIGNGKLVQKTWNSDSTLTWTWEVKNPINNYNIVPYIGNYVLLKDQYRNNNGNFLSLDYWVLDYNRDKASRQFTAVKPMLQCFEDWFGPYPFYEDGFKLVEAPHLGMEHQSAIAYGNGYMNGYRGRDLSGTGWGKKWDFILVHESGHEWFGNNITTRDIADMWVHEGFTSYSETIYTECEYGKKAADEYLQGIRLLIENDQPIIASYGVNQEGSGDMYYKGSNMIHTIRQLINNDSVFKSITRGLNKEFYHQTVSSKMVEAYISKKAGIDLSKIFDQYLRTTKIPELQYRIEKNRVAYRWNNVVDGFAMKIKIQVDGKEIWITPGSTWKYLDVGAKTFTADNNFYVEVKKV